MEKKDKVKQGKKNRAAGKLFERRVRADLEKKGWIVDRWSNNVEFAQQIGTEGHMKDANEYPGMKMMSGKLIPAKHIFNYFTKAMSVGNGFPDFIAYSFDCYAWRFPGSYNIGENESDRAFVIGIECKGGNEAHKYLDEAEKEKCKWLIDNHIFSKILVAERGKKRGEILYKEWKL